jgi:CRISPR-associated protein Cmr6
MLDGGHAGLWYDKYCDTWRDGWTMSTQGASTPKLTWIEKVANGARVGNSELLAESVTRLHRLTDARGGKLGIFTTESRLVTGLGRSHPVENGFAWHPTLGVPYLPGSSVKGLVRAWAERDADPAPPEAVRQRLFGRADAPRSAGRVVFLDALPTAPVKLEADVMTPHYAGWTPAEPPGDWREPIPVPFLVVAPQTSFFFSLLPRGIVADEFDAVFEWLRSALLGAGAGAKTAVGYGRFTYDDTRTAARKNEHEEQRRALEQAARRAKLEGTPEGRWLAELAGKREREVFALVRIHLETSPIDDASERRAFARAVVETPYLARWRKGEKEDKSIAGGPARFKALAKLVDLAAELQR